jgi:hypothetical protein
MSPIDEAMCNNDWVWGVSQTISTTTSVTEIFGYDTAYNYQTRSTRIPAGQATAGGLRENMRKVPGQHTDGHLSELQR